MVFLNRVWRFVPRTAGVRLASSRDGPRLTGRFTTLRPAVRPISRLRLDAPPGPAYGVARGPHAPPDRVHETMSDQVRDRGATDRLRGP